MNEPQKDEISWTDGDMPFSQSFGDHFYSRADGRAECRHVFLQGNGLPERWAGAEMFTIGELGFGTGLNFLETWRTWRETRAPGKKLRFVSFEKYPMRGESIGRALGAWRELAPLGQELLARWSSLTDTPTTWEMDSQTTLMVVVGEALDGVGAWENTADAWYLDGFAPSKNPQMWTAELMQAVADHTAERGTCATYTVAGWVRRNLDAAGFAVEKRPGHGEKREMVCGVKR